MIALVTGATGFVGSAVLRALLEAGHECQVLARPDGDRRNLDGLQIEIFDGDLNDPASLAAAARGCESLFHVAADYRLWVPDPAPMLATNVAGTKNILRAAADAGVSRMVYTSSVAALGATPDDAPTDETAAPAESEMVGQYKRSKFLAEQAVGELVRDEGLPVVIVNPSMPVGPRDIKPTPTGRIILNAATGKMPAYVDTGLNVVHVDDVAAGHLQVYDHGKIGERYILGGENLSLREILRQISQMVGRRPPIARVPHGLVLPIAYLAEGWARLFRTAEPFVTVDGIRMAKKRMYFSSDKATAQLGYAPRPAHMAFRDAIDWFRDNGYLK